MPNVSGRMPSCVAIMAANGSIPARTTEESKSSVVLILARSNRVNASAIHASRAMLSGASTKGKTSYSKGERSVWIVVSQHPINSPVPKMAVIPFGARITSSKKQTVQRIALAPCAIGRLAVWILDTIVVIPLAILTVCTAEMVMCLFVRVLDYIPNTHMATAMNADLQRVVIQSHAWIMPFISAWLPTMNPIAKARQDTIASQIPMELVRLR